MLKHGLLLIIMLAILFTGKTARPIPLQSGSEPGLPLPATGREQAAVAPGEETAAPQIAGLDKEENVPITGQYSLDEAAPLQMNRMNRITRNFSDPENQPLSLDEAAPQIEAADFPPVPESTVNFLLLGHRRSKTEVLLVVSLIPGQTACLLAVHPDAVKQSSRNWLDRLATNPKDPAARKELNNRLEEISGKKIQFMIGLDLEGVIEMVDVMGGVKFNSGGASSYDRSIEGHQAVDLLTRELIPAREKQRLLRAILLEASALELTKVGWTLLKIGYHSLSTDLSVADLLQLRKVTHSISPYRMIYRELP